MKDFHSILGFGNRVHMLKRRLSDNRFKHGIVTIEAKLATRHCAGCLHKEHARDASIARA